MLMKNITPEILNKKEIRKFNEGYVGYEANTDSRALYGAVDNNNNEIVKILLSNDYIDVNYNYRSTVTAYANLILLKYITAINIHCTLFLMQYRYPIIQ